MQMQMQTAVCVPCPRPAWEPGQGQHKEQIFTFLGQGQN